MICVTWSAMAALCDKGCSGYCNTCCIKSTEYDIISGGKTTAITKSYMFSKRNK